MIYKLGKLIKKTVENDKNSIFNNSYNGYIFEHNAKAK